MKLHNDGKELLTFDDVLIRPGYSDMKSRLDPETRVEFFGYKVEPIIVANMVNIATVQMAKSLAPLDFVVPLHRFSPDEKRLEEAKELNDFLAANAYQMPVCVSVGLKEHMLIDKLWEYADVFFLELAHAATEVAVKEVRRLRDTYSGINLVVGNVGTKEHTEMLLDAGADIVKCGIGPGSACTTRKVTGCGVPQLSAIDECSNGGSYPIIGDGGIKSTGDIAKALGAGARTVMVGKLFAGTDETDNQNAYSGMSSKESRVRAGNYNENIMPEGVSMRVIPKGSAVAVAKSLLAGLKPAMTMVGARTIEELQEKAIFQRVSPLSLVESNTREEP